MISMNAVKHNRCKYRYGYQVKVQEFFRICEIRCEYFSSISNTVLLILKSVFYFGKDQRLIAMKCLM